MVATKDKLLEEGKNSTFWLMSNTSHKTIAISKVIYHNNYAFDKVGQLAKPFAEWHIGQRGVRAIK